MGYFLYKLIPPRATFPQDMTEAEGKLMQEHVAYWKGFADRRIAVIFGPVVDPKGAYGLAIVDVEDDTTIRDIGKNAPAIKANVGFSHEIYLMPEPILREP